MREYMEDKYRTLSAINEIREIIVRKKEFKNYINKIPYSEFGWDERK